MTTPKGVEQIQQERPHRFLKPVRSKGCSKLLQYKILNFYNTKYDASALNHRHNLKL